MYVKWYRYYIIIKYISKSTKNFNKKEIQIEVMKVVNRPFDPRTE